MFFGVTFVQLAYLWESCGTRGKECLFFYLQARSVVQYKLFAQLLYLMLVSCSITVLHDAGAPQPAAKCTSNSSGLRAPRSNYASKMRLITSPEAKWTRSPSAAAPSASFGSFDWLWWHRLWRIHRPRHGGLSPSVLRGKTGVIHSMSRKRLGLSSVTIGSTPGRCAL
jgi:hypothetical protein